MKINKLPELDSISSTRLLKLDSICSHPSLLPGDVIETKAGNIGVIIKAKTLINGCNVNWNDSKPNQIKHGREPSYSVEFTDIHIKEKMAWWIASEFKRVIALSHIRNYISH